MCLLLHPRLSLFSTMAYGGGSDIPPRLLKFFSILLLTHHAFALHVAQSRTGEPMIFEKSSSGFQPVAEEPEILSRERRHAQTSKEIDHWISYLNDSHQQLMVHWVGVGSNVVICVARTSPISAPIPSSVYISYDYGSTFVNKTDYFALDNQNTSFASLDRFTAHPKFNKVVVFIDAAGKAIFTTTNYGNTIKRVKLDFHPSEITFIETDPSTFLALDKIDPSRKLWLTKDLGETWEMVQESVKTFALSTINNAITALPNVVPISNYPFVNDDSTLLFVLRQEPTGKGTILSSPNLFSEPGSLKIWMNNVDDFQMKGNFMFATQVVDKGGAKELFISYKRGPLVRAVFLTELERINYFIADVSDGQIFVVAAHTNTIANLYASMSIDEEKVTFALAHERIFCYFPNHSWQETWLSGSTEEAFADFYKVEGLHGIYIASFVTNLTDTSDIGPQHLQTMITFDRGVTWQPLNPPLFDENGSPIKCIPSQGCSLHLSQRFNQLYPSNRAVPILSSPSAPGIILATGVIGKSLKGRPGVFLSRDGGLTWRQILKDYYFFSYGDYGAVLTAVKFYRSYGETREILYSTDEGENFNNYLLPMSQDLRVYGLMTEPGFNTTVFTMFGSQQGQHQWLIVKVDLKNAFARNCEKKDYKYWSPHAEGHRVGCLLGLKETYERRLATSNCYNGVQYVRPVRVEICECQMEDFECDTGFEKHLVTHQCVRNESSKIDPWAVPSFCPPGTMYNRTKGYRRKPGDSCLRGQDNLYLPDEIPCPLGEKKEFLLVAQRDKIGRVDLNDYKMEILPITNLKNVIAIEFDMRNNCIYWADIVLDVIMRQCLRDGKSRPEVLIQNNLVSVEGMALDWVSNNLYFVDGVAAKISLFRIDIENQGRMRRVILDKRTLKKPRGIAVHPKLGYLFWTDWDAKEPTVSRSNLDGTNVKHMFKKPLVEWPNGLTIDTISERLCWVDARQDYIACSDLEGSERSFRKILSGDDRVTHPFAVTVFKDRMFWDDWKKNSIFSADKDKGSDVHSILGDIAGLMDLKVFAHSVQEGTNKCASRASNNCSHICVGAPRGSYVCLCPDNMVLVGETCLCPGKQPPNSDGSCPLVDAKCEPGYFACPEKSCIPDQWVCDKENDCHDGADELDCNKSHCKSNMFMCKNGQCIPNTWVCDHDVDCLDDESDESQCDYSACKSDQYTCHNRRCIPVAWRCDEENDCLDNSDEIGCNKTGVVLTCKPGEFRCGAKCIPTNWRCDGEKDCASGEDESDCKDEKKCPNFQFQCLNQRCIVENWRCDGENDCGDNSDEKNCTEHAVTDRPKAVEGECYDWTFACHSGGKCIPYWWKCDGVDDCGDKSDEVGCDVSTLPPRLPTPAPPPGSNPCQPHQFRCASGDCIQQAWVCDGMKDCEAGEDEAACHETGCGPNQFQCRVDGSCVFLSQVCDGRKQCPDRSDEEDCDHKNKTAETAGPSCASGYFPCDGSICTALAHRCDGELDCYDGTDEAFCSNGDRVFQVLDIGTDPRGLSKSTLLVFWNLAHKADGTAFEFLPSYAKVEGDDYYKQRWVNSTWTNATNFKMEDLEPFTLYNITVYVRTAAKRDKVVPPATYISARTDESFPTAPVGLSVVQKTARIVEVTWHRPILPNGDMKKYTVYFSPPIPPNKKTFPAKSSTKYSAEVEMDFKPGVNYTFWVVAHNDHYESPFSAPANLVISPKFAVSVRGLRIVGTTENSITAIWDELHNVSSYTVRVRGGPVYPLFPDRNTTTNKVTVDDLSPGILVTVQVVPQPAGFLGLIATARATTAGPSLAAVANLNVTRSGGSVHLSWAAYSSPPRPKNTPWVFGIYYATSPNQLLNGPKMIIGGSKTTSVDIAHLEPCESYLIAVGVVRPHGPGPLSKPVTFMTDFDENAAPKQISVTTDENDPMMMVVRWSSSCPDVTKAIHYDVSVTDTWLNKTSQIRLLPSTGVGFTQKMKMTYGASYRIWVTTSGDQPRPSAVVLFNAPPIPSPIQVHAYPNNGSYVLYWSTPPDLPKEIIKYHYEIALACGRDLGSPDVRIISTDNPTYILDHVREAGIYSFAVRLVAEDGHKSEFSEMTSFATTASLSQESNSDDGSVLTRVLVPCLLVLLVMSGILVFFIVRHRRLQRSFTNFANSHYDRRSGSTTFSGDGLEDEDSPVIRGFSDDEPLVIA